MPSARYSFASDSVIRSSQRCVGCPKSSATFSTAVVISSSSASISFASSEQAWSLSITAAMPVSSPFASATTGMPPPPDRDHDEAVLDQGADRVDLDDADRLR